MFECVLTLKIFVKMTFKKNHNPQTFKGALSYVFTEKRNLPERTLKSTMNIEVVPICRLRFPAKLNNQLPWLCSQGKVEGLYILRPPVGKALGGQLELPTLLRHTSPLGVTSKAIPGQPRGLGKCSLSGQLFGRHQAAVVPKGEEPGWEEPAELLHPPPGSRAAAARWGQRRVGLVTPKYFARPIWGMEGVAAGSWHLSLCNRTRVL